MSADTFKHRNTIWEIKIEKPGAALAQTERDLAAFSRHRKALVDKLRSAHQRGPKSKPFDSGEAWRDLKRIATFYLSAEKMEQDTLPAGVRVKRLGKLARALGRARRMADQAMQDDVGSDLFKALAAERGITWKSIVRIGKDGPSVLTGLADEMKKSVEDLAALESAAIRAAKQTRSKPGRPKGTSVLPAEYIIALALAYRNSTESKPGAGPGPFARFVCDFLGALGRRNLASASVIEAIKDARAEAPALLAIRQWGPSPFE